MPDMTTTTLVQVPGLLADPALLAAAPHPDPRHGHSTDDIAGYVIRRVIQDGATLPHGPGAVRPGQDLAVVLGADSYAEALDLALHYRRRAGQPARTTSYAVVDSVWPCGCRS